MNWTLRIKYLLADALYRLGILPWIMHRRLSGKTVVLMYHRVLPEAAWQESLSSDSIIVTPATFRRHLAWLKQEFELLGLQRFRAWLTGNQSLPRPGCLITFDDGWYDNHVHALPKLREAGVPAMICLATGFIGTKRTFWQEQLGQALWRLAQRNDPEARTFLAELELSDLAAHPSAVQRLRIIHAVRGLKRKDWAQIETLLQQAVSLCGAADPGEDRFLDWDHARSLQSSGVILFSHGSNHRLLPQLNDAELHHELQDSRECLYKELGIETIALAYPNGNHDDRVVAAAVAEGYRIAFTTERGPVNQGDDPMRLRRINISELTTRSPAMLACRLSGIF